MKIKKKVIEKEKQKNLVLEKENFDLKSKNRKSEQSLNILKDLISIGQKKISVENQKIFKSLIGENEKNLFSNIRQNLINKNKINISIDNVQSFES